MAIETLSDLEFFFDTGSFGKTASIISPDLGDVNGILDKEVNELDIGIDAEVPVFTAPTAQLLGVVEGSLLVCDGETYQVKNRRDDGTGITDLELFLHLDVIFNFFRPDGESVYFRPDGESYYLRAI